MPDVGTGRFELPTSCTQSRRATKLRYVPKTSTAARLATGGPIIPLDPLPGHLSALACPLMKTSVERESPTKVRLLVEIEPSEVEQLTTDTVKKLSQEFKVPGFRKGKVPRQILESRLGRETIRQRMLEDSLPRLYTDAAHSESLRPVATPEIDVTNFEGSSLAFTATVEVRPDVHLPNYKDLEVQRPSVQATREEIDDRLEVLRQRFATLEPVSRNADKGDHVLIDVRTTLHDEKIEEASANDLLYEVGSGTFAPEIDDELTGKRAGDIVKFNSVLPERLSKDRAGQEVTMTVIVKEVNAKALPDINDDFAKTASEFDTLEELEREIRNRIEEYKGVQAEREVSNRLLDELLDMADIPVPESLIEGEAQTRMQTLLRDVQQHGMTVDDYLGIVKLSQEELADAQRKAAERSIGADFLLDAIAEAEGMNVNRAELDEEIERLAKRAGHTPDELRREIVQQGRVEALAGDILRRKVLNYLGALLRHLLPPPEGPHHLPGHADRRQRRQPRHGPAHLLRVRGPRPRHLALHQLAGRLDHGAPGHLRHHAVHQAARGHPLHRPGGERGGGAAGGGGAGQAVRPAELPGADPPAGGGGSGRPGGGHRDPRQGDSADAVPARSDSRHPYRPGA